MQLGSRSVPHHGPESFAAIEKHGNTDSIARYFGGDATSVRVDANREEVTYVWNSKVHVSSGTCLKEIRAVAVAVDDGEWYAVVTPPMAEPGQRHVLLRPAPGQVISSTSTPSVPIRPPPELASLVKEQGMGSAATWPRPC